MSGVTSTQSICSPSPSESGSKPVNVRSRRSARSRGANASTSPDPVRIRYASEPSAGSLKSPITTVGPWAASVATWAAPSTRACAPRWSRCVLTTVNVAPDALWWNRAAVSIRGRSASDAIEPGTSGVGDSHRWRRSSNVSALAS